MERLGRGVCNRNSLDWPTILCESLFTISDAGVSARSRRQYLSRESEQRSLESSCSCVDCLGRASSFESLGGFKKNVMNLSTMRAVVLEEYNSPLRLKE